MVQEPQAVPRGKLQKLKEFWLATKEALAIAASVITFIVVVSLYFTGRFASIDSLNSQMEEVDASVKDLKDVRLRDLENQLKSMGIELAGLGGKVDPEISKTYASLVARSGALERDLRVVEIEIARLRESSHGMVEVRQGQRQLLDEHSSHAQDVRRLEAKINDLRESIARLETLGELIKPFIAEKLSMGRISVDDLRKFYSPKEVDQFIRDARDLLDGKNELDEVVHATLNADGSCSGAPSDCMVVSLSSPGKQGRMIIELVTESQSLQLAKLSHLYAVPRYRQWLERENGSFCTAVAKLNQIESAVALLDDAAVPGMAGRADTRHPRRHMIES